MTDNKHVRVLAHSHTHTRARTQHFASAIIWIKSSLLHNVKRQMACFPSIFKCRWSLWIFAWTSEFCHFGAPVRQRAKAPHAWFQTGIGFGCPRSGAILAASAHLGLIILAKYGPACVQLSDEAEQSAGRERSGIKALFIPLQSRGSCRAIVH